MTWKTPESEEAWEECLSTYIDGEMSADDIIELERILETNPERSAQLEEICHTSCLLQEWEIDVPTPDPAFVQEACRLTEPKQDFKWKSWFKTLRMQSALPSFLIGIFVGIVFMTLASSGNTSDVLPTTTVERVISESAISPSQAEKLLGEMEAEGLKTKVLNELKQQNADRALETFEELQEKYPESRALKDLNENRKLSLLRKRPELASLNPLKRFK